MLLGKLWHKSYIETVWQLCFSLHTRILVLDTWIWYTRACSWRTWPCFLKQTPKHFDLSSAALTTNQSSLRGRVYAENFCKTLWYTSFHIVPENQSHQHFLNEMKRHCCKQGITLLRACGYCMVTITPFLRVPARTSYQPPDSPHTWGKVQLSQSSSMLWNVSLLSDSNSDFLPNK